MILSLTKTFCLCAMNLIGGPIQTSWSSELTRVKFVIRVSSVLGPLMWQWASADGNCWAEEQEATPCVYCVVSARSHLTMVRWSPSTIILSLSLARLTMAEMADDSRPRRLFYNQNFLIFIRVSLSLISPGFVSVFIELRYYLFWVHQNVVEKSNS